MNIEEHKQLTHEAEIQLDEINRLLKLYEKEQSVETADQVISAYKKQIGLLGKIIESRTRSDVVLVNTTSAMWWFALNASSSTKPIPNFTSCDLGH